MHDEDGDDDSDLMVIRISAAVRAIIANNRLLETKAFSSGLFIFDPIMQAKLQNEDHHRSKISSYCNGSRVPKVY